MNAVKGIAVVVCIALVCVCTGCQSVNQFKQKVITETEKTASYTVDPDVEPATMEQLIDQGRTDCFVFNGAVYQMQHEVKADQVGRALGSVGEMYFVDQNGKRWSKQELKQQPYVYANPQNVREKKPLKYGVVYQLKQTAADAEHESVIIRFNDQYRLATKSKG
ncbi:NisI/SpaI family lantibiotic immunity lipoprotein [Paenibacillus campi]|uniref:NisI/SpaI family lantibiotic immunity lipoprotein n=1 Tax=Paenibacillus campi TaxID=3106031 RepID=UPI002AFF5379|nr:NisI/SpaI family lantibiotic immunity lipoprotein [Paenibacillus sp. SGZ-1014]